MLHIIIAHIVHTLLRCVQTSSACVWHKCDAGPIVYAAYMQNDCLVSTYAACKFNTCRKVANTCAAHKYKQHFCKGWYTFSVYDCLRLIKLLEGKLYVTTAVILTDVSGYGFFSYFYQHVCFVEFVSIYYF